MISLLARAAVAVAVAAGLTGVATGSHGADTAAASHAADTAAGSGGDIRVTGAHLGAARSGYRPLYLTLQDTGAQPDLLEAVIAPDATSATWVMTDPVHTPAEVAAYEELCGNDPRLLAQSAAALKAGSQVVLTAHGSTPIEPGSGRIQLNGFAGHAATTPVTLWFASGAEVSLSVPTGA